VAVATRDGEGKPGAQRASKGEERASSRPRKALTIGAVCKILGQEFEDISISKIRYLEDQKLLAPARTPGGYRLYSQADVECLRTILRMQRDEFLPLRVIRQELLAGGSLARAHAAGRGDAVSPDGSRAPFDLEELLSRSGAKAELVRELQEFGILRPRTEQGEAAYDETDLEIVRAAGELARFGVSGRNLRVFRSSADHEASLLEQILAPSLRSRSRERRREAVENLESLAAVCTQLGHLLLLRELRQLTE
jgi:hypothetical protein